MVNDEKLRILMVEHAAEDAERIMQLLAQGGFQSDYLRVTTAVDLQNALLTQHWDIVLSDYD